jgi:GNAT superfamily N-acetyltransferase
MLERRIEEAALNSWPALQQILFDGWVIRFAGGYTKRANSVTPVYPSELALLEKIAFCERLYQEQHLPTIFRLPSFSLQVQEIDRLLAQKGYTSMDQTLVLSAPLMPGENQAISGFHSVALDEWLPLYSQFSLARPEQQASHRAILQHIVPRSLFALYYEDGLPVACGLGVLENGIFGLFDIVTSFEQRKRGYGARLVTGMLAWARQNGGNQAYLQVVKTNQVARHLYAKFGFQEQYHYWYRVQPATSVL